MRNYKEETKRRVQFIREILNSEGAEGIVYGNSGGKDSALVGILCKMACDNTIGIIMPCGSKRNYSIDKEDAERIAKQFFIDTYTVDLSLIKDGIIREISNATAISSSAVVNIAPRLRMTTLYAIAASENKLVAGTGNRSECYMGYFTKWGDGACDFNPIADLTVTEIYEFLHHLGAPEFIIEKAPSAGLYDGQTDEIEMGISYKNIDNFLLNGIAHDEEREIIEAHHYASAHKRSAPISFEI